MEIKNENKNENGNGLFQQEIQKELFAQTFQKNETEFSSEKIEHLVGLLEIENPTDDREVMEAQKAFEEKFRQTHRKAIRNNRLRTYCRKVAGAAAVLMLVVMTADFTTKAVMDEGLFHMVSRWTNQLAIRPSVDSESQEVLDFVEGETKYFNSIDEFAEYFGDDFLVCSWLPDGVELNEIVDTSVNEFSEIFFEYTTEKQQEWKMQIWMYQGENKETAGFASGLEQKVYKKVFINGRKIIYYKKDEGLLVGFEYQDWWYLIDISVFEENTLESILKGMVEYGTTEK